MPLREFVLFVAVAPDGGSLVTHEIVMGGPVTEQVIELTIRSPEDGQVVRRVPVPVRTVDQLLFAPQGQWLVVRAGPALLVWDGALAKEPAKIRSGTRKHFTGIAFHPSGRYLAATSKDTVRVYDTATWQIRQSFAWDIGQLRSVAFSPDGCLAAAGGDSGKVVVWDVDL
jgi:WD40 repeat protein